MRQCNGDDTKDDVKYLSDCDAERDIRGCPYDWLINWEVGKLKMGWLAGAGES